VQEASLAAAEGPRPRARRALTNAQREARGDRRSPRRESARIEQVSARLAEFFSLGLALLVIYFERRIRGATQMAPNGQSLALMTQGSFCMLNISDSGYSGQLEQTAGLTLRGFEIFYQ